MELRFRMYWCLSSNTHTHTHTAKASTSSPLFIFCFTGAISGGFHRQWQLSTSTERRSDSPPCGIFITRKFFFLALSLVQAISRVYFFGRRTRFEVSIVLHIFLFLQHPFIFFLNTLPQTKRNKALRSAPKLKHKNSNRRVNTQR